MRQGRLTEAEKHYREAAAVYESLDATGPRAAAVNNIAEMLRHQGYRDEAGRTFERAMELRRRAGDRRGEGVTLLGLGRLAADRGRHDLARRSFWEARDLFEEAGHPDGVAEALLGAAEAALDAGDGDAALRELERVEALAADPGSSEEHRQSWRAEASRLRARHALARGEAGRAVELAGRSLRSHEERFDREGRVRSGALLARALVAAGRLGEARALTEELAASPWVREDAGLRVAVERLGRRVRSVERPVERPLATAP